jgi:hypothetical protein
MIKTNLRVLPGPGITTSTPKRTTDPASDEIDTLTASAASSGEFGDAVRAKAEQLVSTYAAGRQLLLFRNDMVQLVRGGGKSKNVLFIGTRSYELKGEKFVVNVRINGLLAREQTRLFFRDSRNEPVRAMCADTRGIWRVSGIRCQDGMLLRYFAHRQPGGTLREWHFQVFDGDVMEIEVDHYVRQLRAHRSARRS